MTLHFAPIIRVSTEKQEAKGESLRTQTKQIKQYVEHLKGTIPESCWQYKGQEHATPDQERQKLDKLLEDSSKSLFNAVIVCDASRWSRDNKKSKAGLETLRKNGIRFFIGTMELDLYNPEHILMLGMSAEFGEFQARQQALKSITNRIEKAKRGLPTCGKLPYGRTYDKEKNVWGIDKEKQRKIKQAAARYLKGESIVQVASSLGMNWVNLWKILNHRSGDKWEQSFRADDLNVNETVEIIIPELLKPHMIDAIHERARANKTYTHGEIKHHYLLSRMIFCAKCGYTLFGQTNHETKRYYRHPKHRKETCHDKKWVPADLIENSVLIHLGRTFGDVERLQEAVKKATPDMAKREELAEEREDLQKELKKVLDQKEAVIDAIANREISKEEVTTRMTKYRARETQIKTRLATIDDTLSNLPDPAKVKRLSKWTSLILHSASKERPDWTFKKSYQWKRNLVEHAFGGRDSEKKRFGVYIEETGDEKHPWKFEIRGLLEKALLALPLPDEYLEEAFGLDPEFQDIDAELLKIKKDMSSMSLSSPRQVPL